MKKITSSLLVLRNKIMKPTMKMFAILMFVAIGLTSCQETEVAPVRLSTITTDGATYEVIYVGSEITEIVWSENAASGGNDVVHYNFSWNSDKTALTMASTNDGTLMSTSLFTYIKDGDKTHLGKIVATGNPEATYSVTYSYSDVSGAMVLGYMLYEPLFEEFYPVISANKIVLDGESENEVVTINHTGNAAWWTNVAPEVAAVMFQNDFSYAYFTSPNEVASITDTWTAGVEKRTPDTNGTFSYTYVSGNKISSITSTTADGIQHHNFVYK